MHPYRVWAVSPSQSCLLLAESEKDAIEHIQLLNIYGNASLTAARDSDNWDMPHNYVILPTGGTMPKSERK